jgi:hypothetical protein
LKFPLRAALLIGLAVAAAPAVLLRRAAQTHAEPAVEPDALVAAASRRFLNFVLLPGWLAWGFADYVCHRRSDIEHTSGTHESLTHVLMISTTGAGIMSAMLFEVNGLVLMIMAASTLLHEAVVLWDVGYAAKTRPPSATEQHVHSFLEVLPFTGLAVSVCLNSRDAVALFDPAKRPAQLRLKRKRAPFAPVYNLVIIALVTVTLVVPYAEEFVRCWRVDHTLLPHPARGET